MSYKFCQETEYASIEAVQDAYPGAEHIEPVEGGWAVFDTDGDYQTWLKQV